MSGLSVIYVTKGQPLSWIIFLLLLGCLATVFIMNKDIWIEAVEKQISPNFNDRADSNIDLLVIHNISLPPNQFDKDWITPFFLNQLDISASPYFKSIAHLKVSAHFLIRRQGQIIQYVPLNKRAWHAGVSSFKGKERCNDYSIGIELEGTDTLPYTDIQYQKLQELTLKIQKIYPKITLDRITGHTNIAPNRKTDPGESFDWTRYKKSLIQR